MMDEVMVCLCVRSVPLCSVSVFVFVSASVSGVWCLVSDVFDCEYGSVCWSVFVIGHYFFFAFLSKEFESTQKRKETSPPLPSINSIDSREKMMNAHR